MNSAEKEAVLHCLRAMIDEELCEECPLYGTTGTDHCEKDCIRLAIGELEQKPKSECEHDHEILKTYSDGASAVLDKVRAEIEELAKPNEIGGRGNGKSVRYGLCKALEIIDKYKAEGSGEE